MVVLLSHEGSVSRCLGRDLGPVEGPSHDSDRPLRTPIMGCRGDPALTSVGTGPLGSCCWSLFVRGGDGVVVLLSLEGSGGRCLGRDLGRVEGASPDSDRPLRTPIMGCRGDLSAWSLLLEPSKLTGWAHCPYTRPYQSGRLLLAPLR